MKTTTKKPVASNVHIRWMLHKDMDAVFGIEAANFEFPWSEDDFLRCLRQRNCIGMVAERGENVAAFMIYELHKNRLHLLDFAVHAACQRQGVGRAMVAKLVSKLSSERRSRIMVEVRESNLDAQLFFRAMGFRCISTLPDFYEDVIEDALLFQYRYAGGSA